MAGGTNWDKENKIWVNAVRGIFSGPLSDEMTITGLAPIINAIDKIVGSNRNHAHLPTSGGMDILAVDHGQELNSIELETSAKHVYLVKPRSLHVHYISSSPENSFLLLELDTLKPSGVYSDLNSKYEELLDLGGAVYEDRTYWDQGSLNRDEYGNEIPLPSQARLVTRCFEGKFLFVSKGSLWNGDSSTYDGRHNEMTAAQIRTAIEEMIK